MNSILAGERIYKITSKGQVTLPAQLRNRLGNPESIRFSETENGVQIIPILEEKWETIFDSQDNNGTGIDGKDFLKMLQKG